jgi:hypothetical protein
VHAALVNLRLAHVEKHLGYEPNVIIVAREEDWVGGRRFLVQLDGDGHQLVFLVEVEQANWRNNLRKCKLLVNPGEVAAQKITVSVDFKWGLWMPSNTSRSTMKIL